MIIKKGLLSLHYGCKVNQYETNGMIEQFRKSGYSKVDFDEKTDIYVINTCTVTSMSDKKSRQIIRRAKNINREGLVVVTGCYTEVSKEEVEKLPEVDIIIPNNQKKDIVEIIEKYIKNNGNIQIEEDKNMLSEFLDFETTVHTEKTRISIKVQDGCDNFCSYCIIPYAKGRVRSRKINSIINEIKQTVSEGIKEVVITGIHIASYGKDFEDGTRLIDLLEKINQIEGLKRIRLGSLEPTLITKEFVARLKKLDKICDHFHLSLQSGCNETLKRMNRKYSTNEFKEGVELLRESFPNMALTTDIIVGFPGESEEEFKQAYNFLKDVNFSKMHIFKYSPRKGTPAAKMEGQIDERIKEERSNKLINLSNKNEIDFLDNYIGKKVDVLFEQEEREYIKGHTANYIVIKTNKKTYCDKIENEIKTVEIVRREDLELIGELL